tara:strand:+ start:3184 stop:3393 length:210 start_codon:yes stop_codon:yes gene_type:complete
MRRDNKEPDRIKQRIERLVNIKANRQLISDNCAMFTVDEVMQSNNLTDEFKVGAYHYYKSINKSKWWWQ